VKRLILLRHAKSSWDDPDVPDHERPLSARGKRDAPRMAARLRARHEAPALIITSSAKRALRTAKVVADGWGYPRDALHVEPRLYLADPAQIVAVIGEQQDAFASLLVVGHNPSMTELTNRLVPALALDNLPTAGVVAVDVDVQRWLDLPGAPIALAYYDYPKRIGGD
jgi:phosphohistidine phosphatase